MDAEPAWDPWVERLRNPDDLGRYKAAAALVDEDPRSVSPAARDVLFGIVENPHEKEGVRLFASRAAAQLDPQRALTTFQKAEEAGIGIDGDAWIMLGPIALEPIAGGCTPEECDTGTILLLTLIIGDHPKDARSRAMVPLLLRVADGSDQARGIVYQALGRFGDDLIPLLKDLSESEDEDLKQAASRALADVK